MALRIIGDTEEGLTKRLQRLPSVWGREKIEYEIYSLWKIFNFDQTGRFWKQMPLSTDILEERVWVPGYEAAEDLGIPCWVQMSLEI